jgi:hypothetical protein
LVKKIEEILGV